MGGIEPTTFRSESDNTNHCATEAAHLPRTCHIDFILSCATKLLGVLKKLRSSLSVKALITFYQLYIQPILEYADVVWCGMSKLQADRSERFQLKIASITVSLTNHSTHIYQLIFRLP